MQIEKNKITYSLMRIKDYPAIHALWMATPGMGLNDKDDSIEGIQRFLDRNPNTCFTANLDGHVVGVIMSGHDGRRGYIYHTAVATMFQRRGIASELVELTLQALRTEGIHKVALVAFSHNEAGNAFWQQLGFTKRTDLTYHNKALSDLKRIDT